MLHTPPQYTSWFRHKLSLGIEPTFSQLLGSFKSNSTRSILVTALVENDSSIVIFQFFMFLLAKKVPKRHLHLGYTTYITYLKGEQWTMNIYKQSRHLAGCGYCGWVSFMCLEGAFVLRKEPCMMQFCNPLTIWISWGRTSFCMTNPSLLHVLVRLGLGAPWCIIQKSTLKAWVQWFKQKDIKIKIKSRNHQTTDKSVKTNLTNMPRSINDFIEDPA